MLKVNTGALEQVRRLLEKQQFKQALKDARVAHRQSPSEATRGLLQRCSFARANELQRHGLVPEAKNVLDELCGLQPLPLEIHQPLGDLLIRLGLYEQFAAKFGFSVEAISDEMSLALADVAVVSGRCGMASLNEGSAAIRSSLKALEEGEIETAMQAVEPIPRSSPFADWKFLVRGLAAYYRGDDAAMKANWDRLDPKRRATRIASRLRDLADVAAGVPQTDDSNRSLSLVEQTIGGEALSYLDQLRQRLIDGDQRRLIDVLRSCLVALGQRAPKLRDRVVELVTQTAVASSSTDLLKQLIRATSSPAFDPRWNRAWAQLCERDSDLDTDLVVKYWENYAGDIADVQIWSDVERRLAEGLVWNHLGRLYAVWSRSEDDEDEYDLDQGAIEEDRRRARDCFAKAQALAPDVLKIWNSPIFAAGLWKDDEGEVEALLKLLEHFPDDIESLTSAGTQLMTNDRAVEALPLFKRALRLKPLDESLRTGLYTAHLLAARELSLAKDFSAARQHFDEAAKCDPTKVGNIELLARRSIFERKAGNLELAEELDSQACRANADPTYALLQLVVGAIRFQLPKTVVNRYEKDWQKSLRNKCSSQTAGCMSELLIAHLQSKRPYDGIKSHCELVAGYLKRATKVKFDRQHLRHVCGFFLAAAAQLGIKTKPMDELRKAATRGQKQFPDDPCFPMHLCDVEYARGPRLAKLASMSSLLNRALKLAEQHPDLTPPGLIDKIRNRQEEVAGARSFPFFDPQIRIPGFPVFASPEGPTEGPIEINGRQVPPEIQIILNEMCQATGMAPEEVIEMFERTMPAGKSGRRG